MLREIHQLNKNNNHKIIKNYRINYFIQKIKYHQLNLILIIVKDNQKIVLHLNFFHKILKLTKTLVQFKNLFKQILQVEVKKNHNKYLIKKNIKNNKENKHHNNKIN